MKVATLAGRLRHNLVTKAEQSSHWPRVTLLLKQQTTTALLCWVGPWTCSSAATASRVGGITNEMMKVETAGVPVDKPHTLTC